MPKSNINLAQKLATPQLTITEIINKAFKAGVAGAASMTLHVACLMWMRTIMNYQYKNGGKFIDVYKTLLNQGGYARFYRGVVPALFIGPLFRFGDVACNMFATNLSKSNPKMKKLPIFIQTSIGSVLAGFWRLFFIPLDAWKTSKQVHGKEGLQILLNKSKKYGFSTFYQGGLAQVVGTTTSHFTWFLVHNYLQEYFPKLNYRDEFSRLVIRSGVIGLLSTIAADCISNSQRVLKTFKQTSSDKIKYSEAIRHITENGGVSGLFLRGIFTKFMINAIQGVSFSISWKLLEHRLQESTSKKQ